MGLFQERLIFPLNELKLVIYAHGGNLGKFHPPASSYILVPCLQTSPNFPPRASVPSSSVWCWKFSSKGMAWCPSV